MLVASPEVKTRKTRCTVSFSTRRHEDFRDANFTESGPSSAIHVESSRAREHESTKIGHTIERRLRYVNGTRRAARFDVVQRVGACFRGKTLVGEATRKNTHWQKRSVLPSAVCPRLKAALPSPLQAPSCGHTAFHLTREISCFPLCRYR